MSFTGLTEEHFAAYTQDKWSSNVHNLARMAAKDTMQQLCLEAVKGLGEELSGLERAASDEVPNIINQKRVDAQWIYWFRNAKERENLASFLRKTPLNQKALLNIAPHDKHAVLAVVLCLEHLWIGLRIGGAATVDRRNTAALFGKSWHRQRFVELVQDLPAGASVRMGELEIAANDLQPDGLGELVEGLESDDVVFEVGHTLPAEDARNLATDLPDYVSRWLGAFAPLYRFVSWSGDNDHIDVTKQLQEEKTQKRRQVRSLKSGDKVRITGGFFAGKLGVVENTDTKAQVKVRIGTMTIQVKGEHLVPA